MPIIPEKDRETVRTRLESEVSSPVKIVLFTQRSKLLIPGRECQSCEDTERLMDELATLSDNLSLEVHDFYGEREEAARYGVERIPSLVFQSDGQTNVRYAGIPLGYEFALVLDTLGALATGTPRLKPQTLEAIKAIDQDIHIQVFVTPT